MTEFVDLNQGGYYFLDILPKILDILWALLYSDAYMEPVPLFRRSLQEEKTQNIKQKSSYQKQYKQLARED